MQASSCSTLDLLEYPSLNEALMVTQLKVYDGDGPVTAWKDKPTAGKVQRQRGKGLITLTV